MMRVLVISPDAGLEEFLTRELPPDEFEIVGTRPGPGMVPAARRGHADIAVVDRVDSRRDAAALELAVLRDVRRDVRLIVVSGAPSPEDARLVEDGIFYYLPASPPVRLPELVRAAARSIAEARQRSQQGGLR